MPRATTKAELMTAATTNYTILRELIDGLTETEIAEPFDFSSDPQKKEAHWARDRNLKDVVTHLVAWHELLNHWIQANMQGVTQPFLPEPYNWRTYGVMNVEIRNNHNTTSLNVALSQLQQSYETVIALANGFSNKELFSKGEFSWTGSVTLGSYFVSTTSSHYLWAIKKIKAHKKNCAMKKASSTTQ